MIKRFKPGLIAFALVFAVAFMVPGVLLPATAAAATPDVSTYKASDIGEDYATLYGAVVDDGGLDISEFGFYYGTDADDVADGEDGTSDSDTANGDPDDFYLDLTGLDSDQTYYFMAYAINDDGTSYGSVRSFTTKAGVSASGDLDVVTDTPDKIGADTATLNAYVDGYDSDNYQITKYGFFYGPDEGDVDDVEDILADGDNDWDCTYHSGDYRDASSDEYVFSLTLKNLDPDEETYYYRAYIEYEDDNGDEFYSLGDIEQIDLITTPPSVFTLGSNVYNLRGSTQVMDIAPYAKDNRTYLPVRYVAYTMGLTDDQIRWSPLVPNTVTLTNGTTTVILNIGSPIMYKNGTPMMMDVAPEVSNYRTCLPIAWVSQAFGYTATWDGSLKVTISPGTGSSTNPASPATSTKGKVILDDSYITLAPDDETTITGTLKGDNLEIDSVDYEVDGDNVVSVDIDIDGNSFDATISADSDATDRDEATVTFIITDTDGNDYEVSVDISIEE